MRVQLPPQWINCDLRRFDYSVLGKFHVIMADPPWDIHMSVSISSKMEDPSFFIFDLIAPLWHHDRR